MRWTTGGARAGRWVAGLGAGLLALGGLGGAAVLAPAAAAATTAAPVAAAAAPTLGQPRFGTPVTTPAVGNPIGGGPGTAPCGDGYALTAVSGYQNPEAAPRNWLNGIRPTCRAVLSDGTAASLGTPNTLDGIGHTDIVAPSVDACPAGAVAVGFQGRSGTLVDQVQLICAVLNPDGTLGTPAASTPPTGGTGGIAFAPLSCPPGDVATGLSGRSGDSLDLFALQCASLRFVTDHALAFTGTTSDGRVVAPARTALQDAATLTITADVDWDGTTGTRGIVSLPGADSVEPGLVEGTSLLLLDGRPCLRVSVADPAAGRVTREACAAAALPTGRFVTLTGTYDGTVSTVAVNGVTTSRTWPSAQGPDYATDFAGLVVGGLFSADVAGGTPPAQSSGFTGQVDDVTFASGVGTTTPLVRWSFDEGAGTTTLDLSGHGLDGRLRSLSTLDAPAALPQWVVRDRAADPDNTTWPTARLLTSGAVEDGALLRPGESRWYKLPVVPDEQVSVDVTGLAANYDVALFKDIGQAFTTLLQPSDLNRLSAEFAGDAFAPSVFSPSVFSPSVFSPSVFSPSVFSPSVFSPSVFSPSVFSPSVFSPSVFSPSVFSPSVFSPSVFSPSVFSPSVFSPSVFSPSVFSPSVFSGAWSSAQTRSLIAVSANDGLADEHVASATWDNSGFFYIRVTGRSGESSPLAYHLTPTVTGGSCTTPLDSFSGSPTLTPVPGSATTVILTDYSRFAGASAADLATLRQQVDLLAARTGGRVVDLGTLTRLRQLNTQADAVKPCPYAENLVAQAARDIVNGFRSTSGSQTLRYVVVVGGDSVVPFFRYPDAAGLGPENGYVPPVRDDTASQASLRRNTFLSQDAYGAATDVSLKGSVVPVPDVAVGRLVETPAEISATIQRYLDLPGGNLPTATSSLVTGYDFLTDAADAVEGQLSAGIGGTANDTLITDQGVPPTTTTAGGTPTRGTSWTADDLRAKLFGARHDITFLAGHFSANSALAADYSTQVVTTEVASAPRGTFANTVVISAGCHSGYNLQDGDGVPQLTLGLDWAQAFAKAGATLVAGTGYQYGDTDFLEYSERLYADLATQMRTGTGAVPLGQALLAAKQDYLDGTPQLRGIHVKALLESTLYGLPMLGVDLPNKLAPTTSTPAVTPTPVTSGPGAAVVNGRPGLGLRAADLNLTPATTTVTRDLTGTDGSHVTATYLQGPDGTVTNPAEPALPLQSVDVTAKGLTLRGIGLRSGTYGDTDGITPLTGAATTETNAAHAPFTSTAFYPSRLATPNYFDAITDPANGTTRLAVTPAQHRSDGGTTPSGSPTTTLRRWSAVGLKLFYSNNVTTYGTNQPALAAPPSISGVSSDATAANGGIPVRVHVTGDPSAGIQQVWVTYTGEGASPLHGTWASVDLVQDATDSTLWTGSIPLPAGTSAAGVRFVVQAANGVGLVSMDDANGLYYTPGVQAGAAPAVAPAASSLTLGGVLSPVTYGSKVPVSATLKDATTGTPLIGRTVTFSLGGTSTSAVTGTGGVASASLAALDLPGGYALQASFAGDAAAGAAAATAATAFAAATDGASVRIDPQPTKLSLAGPATPPLPGADTGVVATLTAGTLPVRARTVYLAVTDGTGAQTAALTATTDVFGRAFLGAPALTPGTYTVTATFGGTVTLPDGTTTSLADPVLAASSDTLRLTVRPPTTPPTLTGTPPTATAGTPYSFAFALTGVPAPTVSVTSGSLPPGLTLSPAGLLAGTPRTAGTFAVTLTATNGTAPDATLAVTVTVSPGSVAALTPVSGGGQVGTAGQPFDRPLVAKVADALGNPVAGSTVTWTVASGGASFPTPTGGTAATATSVSGAAGTATSPALRADKAGAVSVKATVTAPGATGGTATTTFTLSVLAVASARSDLAVTATAPASAARGSTFTGTVTVTNLGPNTAAGVVTTLAPGPGLAVVTASGGTVVSGVPTFTLTGLPVGASRTFTVTYKVTATKTGTATLAGAAAGVVPDPRLANNAVTLSVRLT